jgi:hypothetical protein
LSICMLAVENSLYIACKSKDIISKYKTYGKLKSLDTMQSPTYFPSGKKRSNKQRIYFNWLVDSQIRIYCTDLIN